MFYKYAHILGPMRSPDMILSAFYVKFDKEKDEIPPRVCRPSKKLKKSNVEQVDPKKVEKNNVEKVDPTKIQKQQCRAGPDRI